MKTMMTSSLAILSLQLFILVPNIAWAELTSTLPNGYVAHPDIGVAYKIHDDTFILWKEAAGECTLEGAKLAVIDSEKKLEYAKLQPLGLGVRHVGIHWTGDKWVSVTNETISTSTIPWAEGEDVPVADGYVFAMIGWNDTYTKLMNGPASFNGDYICEIPLQQ